PKRPASWDGIRNASENGVCSQLDLLTQTVIGDEDCLYLNVYVPCSIHGTMRNPVMIWIHGGMYLIGSCTDVRPDYLLAKEVIVVSINYRLGAFGKTYSFKSVDGFLDPKPPASWDGIRNASENGNVCSQLDLSTETVIGDEDCLYLNVYVPRSIYGTTRIPVMVWIHGGGYLIGSGSDINRRPDYLLAKEVIVVFINYRLGVFGFLKLGHETANGNQGLKDQIAALKWVRENIQVFGGDLENITIFGNSAGAASTHLLMLSPLSKGLFHKAILQSGISTCIWAIKETQQEMISFKLASLLGNDSKDPEEIVEFLRTIPADEIVKAQHQCQFLTPMDVYGMNLQFIPVIDNEVKRPLFAHPIHQLLNDDNDIPIIVGCTSHEYSIFFLDDSSEKTLKMLYEDLPHHVRKVGNLQDPVKIAQLTERAKQWYFNGKPCTENSVPSIIQCMSDIYMNIPTTEFVNSRRKKKEAVTYFYKFSYIGDQTTTKQMMVGHKLRMTGAAHEDELSYLFYIPTYKVNDPQPPAIGTKDRKVLEALTNMWTNFAKTGNPTPAIDQNVTTTWLPATADVLNYLEINDALQCAKITDYTNIFQESD
ncbi:Esterase FE4, partial [Ooceraea biroi]